MSRWEAFLLHSTSNSRGTVGRTEYANADSFC